MRIETAWIIDRKFEFVVSEETIEADGASNASAGLKMNVRHPAKTVSCDFPPDQDV